MSHKNRRDQYLKQKERTRIRQEPVLPADVPNHDPYDFGLFQQPAPQRSDADEMIRQQRRTADMMALIQAQTAARVPHQLAPLQPSASTLWETQSIMAPIFQELQYRELYQIHKALNGGVYLP